MSMALMIRPLSHALGHYNKFAVQHPLLTMSITTGITMGFGSFACQMIKNRSEPVRKPIDVKQIANYSLFGALFTGPVLRYWWYYLDLKIFKDKKAFLRPVKMMILDIATVRFGIIAAFVFYASLCMDKSFLESCSDLKDVNNLN